MGSLDRCDEQELQDGITELHATVSAAQRDLLRFVRSYDRRRAWRSHGCRNMAQWLSGHLGISTFAAGRWTEAAHALEDLPLLSAALEVGALCLDKVLQLARFATPETEQELVKWARRVSVAAIRRKADLAARQALEDTRIAHEDRYLRWWRFDDDKRVGIEGSFPAAQGAAVIKAIDRLADQLPSLPNDPDPVDARRADALMLMASREIADDQDSDRATVVVSADLEALQGDARGCELEGGPVIPPEVARRLSCDCRLQLVIRDDKGLAVGIGRTARVVPAWMMRELLHRDGGCVFPGCGTRRFLEAHHIEHWSQGGETNLDNLILLCSFHHTLVHEHGWTVELGPHHEALWRRPTAIPYDPGPPLDLSTAQERELELAMGFG